MFSVLGYITCRTIYRLCGVFWGVQQPVDVGARPSPLVYFVFDPMTSFVTNKMADNDEAKHQGRLEFLQDSPPQDEAEVTNTETREEQSPVQAADNQRTQSQGNLNDIRPDDKPEVVSVTTRTFQSQPSLRSSSTTLDPNTMKELQEQNRKALIKKYFSLRVSVFLFSNFSGLSAFNLTRNMGFKKSTS